MNNYLINYGHKKKKGFITLAVLSIISLAYFLFDRIVNISIIHSKYSNNILAQAQLKQLVFSGITLSMLQLTQFEAGEDEEVEEIVPGVTKKTLSTPGDITIESRLQSFYLGIIPILNQWQTIELKQDIDGIDATIKFLLTSEEGKLQLNDIFDQKEMKIKPAIKAIVKDFKLLENTESDNNTADNNNLESFLTNIFATTKDSTATDNKTPIFIEDLSTIKLPKGIPLIYDPKPYTKTKKIIDDLTKDTARENKNIYFGDLFTDQKTPDSGINPLLLSNSLLSILGAPINKIDRHSKDFKKNIRDLTKLIKEDVDWSAMQTTFIKIFFPNTNKIDNETNNQQPKNDNHEETKTELIDISKLTQLTTLLTKNIDPTVFSLLCVVSYQGYSKKAFLTFRKQSIKEKYKKDAIIQTAPTNTNPEEITKNNNLERQDLEKNDILSKRCFFVPNGFEIIKLYWL